MRLDGTKDIQSVNPARSVLYAELKFRVTLFGKNEHSFVKLPTRKSCFYVIHGKYEHERHTF